MYIIPSFHIYPHVKGRFIHVTAIQYLWLEELVMYTLVSRTVW